MKAILFGATGMVGQGVLQECLRSGEVESVLGIVPKTRWLRAVYAIMGPLYPVWKALLPKYVTTTAQVGRAMIQVAREGAPKRVLENRDINEICVAEG